MWRTESGRGGAANRRPPFSSRAALFNPQAPGIRISLRIPCAARVPDASRILGKSGLRAGVGRVEDALRARRMLLEQRRRTNGTANEFAAAIGTDSREQTLHTRATERALERADHRVTRIRRGRRRNARSWAGVRARGGFYPVARCARNAPGGHSRSCGPAQLPSRTRLSTRGPTEPAKTPVAGALTPCPKRAWDSESRVR